MYHALQQVGNANHRANSYLGFTEPPVGDPSSNYDDDPEARQSSLDRLDFAIAELRRINAEREVSE